MVVLALDSACLFPQYATFSESNRQTFFTLFNQTFAFLLPFRIVLFGDFNYVQIVSFKCIIVPVCNSSHRY